MPCESEPTHNLGPITTATSAAEGRMKVDVGRLRSRKRRILRRKVRKAIKK